MPNLGKAYVQIVPSAEGIKGSISDVLSGEADDAGKSSGESIGLSLVSKLKGVLAAAGVGAILKETISQGAELQQSIGGIETLFGTGGKGLLEYSQSIGQTATEAVDSFQMLQTAQEIAFENADKAYKTAGMSANEYMQTISGFAASLKQSTANEVEAANVANMAVIDMADNANKMGTSMESVQNAYQGFAKQNYSMLDNLKLGYGGTKSEMERLLEDAKKLTGVKYDINNLSDVYSAIHVIQEDLGITGTTAKEAAETFSGSFASMQASAKNLMADLALGNEVDLSPLLDSVSTFLIGNLFPMIGNILMQLPPIIMQGVQLLASELPGILSQIIAVIQEQGPEYLTRGYEMISNLASGFMQGLPEIITNVGQLVSNVLEYIMQNLPAMMQKGFEIVTNIAQGISNNLPAVITSIAGVIAQILATIASHLPEILQKGLELLGQLLAGIIQAIPQIPGTIMEIINNIKGEFEKFDWPTIGKNLIEGIKNGITSAASLIKDAAMEAAKQAFQAVKDFFGIKSPSKLMRDEVGAYIPAGLAEGILDNEDMVTDAMDSLSAKATGTITANVSGTMGRYAAQTANGATGSPVTINVYQQEGEDGVALARRVADLVNNDVARRKAVFA